MNYRERSIETLGKLFARNPRYVVVLAVETWRFHKSILSDPRFKFIEGNGDLRSVDVADAVIVCCRNVRTHGIQGKFVNRARARGVQHIHIKNYQDFRRAYELAFGVSSQREEEVMSSEEPEAEVKNPAEKPKPDLRTLAQLSDDEKGVILSLLHSCFVKAEGVMTCYELADFLRDQDLHANQTQQLKRDGWIESAVAHTSKGQRTGSWRPTKKLVDLEHSLGAPIQASALTRLDVLEQECKKLISEAVAEIDGQIASLELEHQQLMEQVTELGKKTQELMKKKEALMKRQG